MLQNECTKGSNLSRTAGSQKIYLYCWFELRDYCIYITRKMGESCKVPEMNPNAAAFLYELGVAAHIVYIYLSLI